MDFQSDFDLTEGIPLPIQSSIGEPRTSASTGRVLAKPRRSSILKKPSSNSDERSVLRDFDLNTASAKDFCKTKTSKRRSMKRVSFSSANQLHEFRTESATLSRWTNSNEEDASKLEYRETHATVISSTSKESVVTTSTSSMATVSMQSDGPKHHSNPMSGTKSSSTHFEPLTISIPKDQKHDNPFLPMYNGGNDLLCDQNFLTKKKIHQQHEADLLKIAAQAQHNRSDANSLNLSDRNEYVDDFLKDLSQDFDPEAAMNTSCNRGTTSREEIVNAFDKKESNLDPNSDTKKSQFCPDAQDLSDMDITRRVEINDGNKSVFKENMMELTLGNAGNRNSHQRSFLAALESNDVQNDATFDDSIIDRAGASEENLLSKFSTKGASAYCQDKGGQYEYHQAQSLPKNSANDKSLMDFTSLQENSMPKFQTRGIPVDTKMEMTQSCGKELSVKNIPEIDTIQKTNIGGKESICKETMMDFTMGNNENQNPGAKYCSSLLENSKVTNDSTFDDSVFYKADEPDVNQKSKFNTRSASSEDTKKNIQEENNQFQGLRNATFKDKSLMDLTTLKENSKPGSQICNKPVDDCLKKFQESDSCSKNISDMDVTKRMDDSKLESQFLVRSDPVENHVDIKENCEKSSSAKTLSDMELTKRNEIDRKEVIESSFCILENRLKENSKSESQFLLSTYQIDHPLETNQNSQEDIPDSSWHRNQISFNNIPKGSEIPRSPPVSISSSNENKSPVMSPKQLPGDANMDHEDDITSFMPQSESTRRIDFMLAKEKVPFMKAGKSAYIAEEDTNISNSHPTKHSILEPESVIPEKIDLEENRKSLMNCQASDVLTKKDEVIVSTVQTSVTTLEISFNSEDKNSSQSVMHLPDVSECHGSYHAKLTSTTTTSCETHERRIVCEGNPQIIQEEADIVEKLSTKESINELQSESQEEEEYRNEIRNAIQTDKVIGAEIQKSSHDVDGSISSFKDDIIVDVPCLEPIYFKPLGKRKSLITDELRERIKALAVIPSPPPRKKISLDEPKVSEEEKKVEKKETEFSSIMDRIIHKYEMIPEEDRFIEHFYITRKSDFEYRFSCACNTLDLNLILGEPINSHEVKHWKIQHISFRNPSVVMESSTSKDMARLSHRLLLWHMNPNWLENLCPTTLELESGLESIGDVIDQSADLLIALRNIDRSHFLFRINGLNITIGWSSCELESELIVVVELALGYNERPKSVRVHQRFKKVASEDKIVSMSKECSSGWKFLPEFVSKVDAYWEDLENR